jgi:D-alanyl-D-alanine carboxypeptidase/D-alanyl-D-alanine-endopeptidase (penicillin-binding protein 4)
VRDGGDHNRADALPPFAQVQRLPVVATLRSPPFAEHARLILKVSHNLHASTLPLLLAAAAGQRTLADGLRIQRQTLAELGVPVGELAFGGGAGGARVDAVTPRAAVQLLRAMAHRPEAAAFAAALPVLGVDGTLASAVAADSPARGRARAKTGTYFLNNPFGGDVLLTSKALAGYLDARSGRRVAFAFFVNGVQLADADQTAAVGRDLGALCEILWRLL